MIGDLIPADDTLLLILHYYSYWKLYLFLRKIVGIITSPNLDRAEIQNLTELIQKHNSFGCIGTKNAHMASLSKNHV